MKHQETIDSALIDLASFKVKLLEFDLVQQTYNTSVYVRLSSIDLTQYRNVVDNINIISTPSYPTEDQYLFEVIFNQVCCFFIFY